MLHPTWEDEARPAPGVTDTRKICANDALQWRVVILVPALLLSMVAVAAETRASEPRLAAGKL